MTPDAKRQYNAKWRADNPERMRTLRADWDAANAERKRSATRAWFARHPAYKRDWRARHPDVERTYRDKGRAAKAITSAAYAKAHPDRRAAIEQQRRARKRGLGAGVSSSAWRAVREAYGWRCAYCARLPPAQSLQMEHVDPLSKGGTHDVTNVVPACQQCNSSKQAKTLLVWLASAHRGMRQ